MPSVEHTTNPGTHTTHPSTTAGPAPYRLIVPLRWSDQDAYGHVNNVIFLQLLEDARVQGMREWFGSAGPLDTGLLVASHKVEYLRPVTFRYAPVVVDMWVGKVSGASFDIEYELAEHPWASAPRNDPQDAPDQEAPATTLGGPVVPTQALSVALRARTTIVAYDFNSARPRRIGPGEREVLLQYHGPSLEFQR